MRDLDDSLRRPQPIAWTSGCSTRSTTTTIRSGSSNAVEIRAAVEAKQAGKVRYIGFTGHKIRDSMRGCCANLTTGTRC